jgi:hypothetical protein
VRYQYHIPYFNFFYFARTRQLVGRRSLSRSQLQPHCEIFNTTSGVILLQSAPASFTLYLLCGSCLLSPNQSRTFEYLLPV